MTMSGELVTTTTPSKEGQDGVTNSNRQDDHDAEPPPPFTRSATTLRIICLHGANSNATLLQKALAHLDERLYEKHGIELVYVNSPLRCRDRYSSTSSHTPSSLREEPLRVWWEDNDDLEKKYVGLDASLMLLRQLWTATPFCGMLAVGQGAAVAAMLPFLMMKTTPLFGIFIHGETLLEDDELLMMPDDENWSCLHITSEDPSESSLRLARQLGGCIHQVRSAKLSKNELNVIGKFLVEQKKRLRYENAAGGYALVLRNQLYMVEQQAAQLVAQRIAANPPRPLMAVITPQAAGIGCWQRRQPNEEGGGAPCPSDFLLKRDKRTWGNSEQNGPSRHHPNAATGDNDNINNYYETDAATVAISTLENLNSLEKEDN